MDVRVISASGFDTTTAQTDGMRRFAAVAGSTCGASGIWMGIIWNDPAWRSSAHHHGDVESGIYVLNGRMRVRWGERLEQEVDAASGDFLFIPANTVHQEINLSPDEPLAAVVARGGDNVVINVDHPEAARL